MPHGIDGNSAEQVHPQQWTWHLWRLIPPLLVLLTVLAIWLTRFTQLLANNWAYPLTLLVVGVFAAYLGYRARPRKHPVPLPYPEPAPADPVS